MAVTIRPVMSQRINAWILISLGIGGVAFALLAFVFDWRIQIGGGPNGQPGPAEPQSMSPSTFLLVGLAVSVPVVVLGVVTWWPRLLVDERAVVVRNRPWRSSVSLDAEAVGDVQVVTRGSSRRAEDRRAEVVITGSTDGVRVAVLASRGPSERCEEIADQLRRMLYTGSATADSA